MKRRNFIKTFASTGGGLVAADILPGGRHHAIAGEGKRNKGTKRFKTEVLVCGGGPSGFAAATMAARLGAKVLLIERYGRLGGMAVQAMVNPLMGRVEKPAFSNVIIDQLGKHVDFEALDLKYADILMEAGAEILLHSWITEIKKNGNRVTGVKAVSKEGILEFDADIVVDTTGDGDVACNADAEFEKGRPEDGLLQPMSIMYRIAGVDEEKALLCGGERAAKKVRVPEGIWEEVVRKGQQNGELPENVGVVRTYKTRRKGERGINATQINYVDGTKVQDLTRAELEGRKQAYQIWKFLRKHAPGYENAYISGMPAIVGVRETRRFIGEKYLTRDDLLNGRKHPDAVVQGAQFVIDIHNPAGSGQAEGLAAIVKPYDIPYGCMVPRDIDGLLIGGRCISGSHEAFASYRVQRIAMATGAAVGAAAALAIKEGVQPRNLDVELLQKNLDE